MSILLSLRNYFIEAFAEMKKVVWPTQKQAIFYTILVVVMSVGMAIFFAALDYIFSLGIEALIK